MSWTGISPSEGRKKRAPEVQPSTGSQKPINVVLPCWTGDQHQAKWLLSFLGEMGMTQARFWLACSRECDVEELLGLARKAFSVVHFLEDRENMKSNWHEPGDHPKSASGPNSLFRQIAWHFYVPKLGPWLFLEPDAIPCTRDWYERIATDYRICGKPFMGFHVNPVNHPGVPPHMSGVAVYSDRLPEIASKAVEVSSVAFDIAGVEQLLPQSHNSALIYHKYRAPSFTSKEDFDARVPAHLALFHACKDGSIYPFLRQRLGIKAEEPVFIRQVPTMETLKEVVQMLREPEEVTQPCVDIFIKSRPHDYPWLEWCLKSIGKFAEGFRRTIAKSPAPIPSFGYIEDHQETTVEQHEKDPEPGYLWQQKCKLYADQVTDSEYILYMDSDCVFTRPVSPADFIRDGKPVWLYTPLDKARPDQHVWAPVMEKFLGKKPEHEFMRRHPFIIQRWMLEEFRTFCKYRHGKSLEDYIMGQADPANGLALRFSEWNCLGFFLWEFHRDKVHWVLDSDAEPACVYQGYTHGGEQRKQEDLSKFREILDVCVGATEEREVSLAPAPLTLQTCIEFIASECPSNVEKARFIRKLKKFWSSIPKGYRLNPEWVKAGMTNPDPLVIVPEAFTKPRKKTRPKATPAQKNGISDALRKSRYLTQSMKDKIARTLLCIHSYPGANETVARHWPSYQKFGADRIVGIGTTDNECEWPEKVDGVVDIGENGYMKLKGKDDHLCRRLLDTVKWCLTQPEDKFAIIEYDTVPLRKMPNWKGVNAFRTGGQINGSKAQSFYHNPWLLDRASGEALVRAMEEVLPDSQEYPDNSPDLFFGLACERAGIPVGCSFRLFTRNSLDAPGDLDLAVQAALEGAHVIHGVKEGFEYETIMAALNDEHLALSHT